MSRAFTLLELLLVIIILAILATLYVGAVSRFMKHRHANWVTGLNRVHQHHIEVWCLDGTDDGYFELTRMRSLRVEP